jgi:hypothetical protein
MHSTHFHIFPWVVPNYPNHEMHTTLCAATNSEALFIKKPRMAQAIAASRERIGECRKFDDLKIAKTLTF